MKPFLLAIFLIAGAATAAQAQVSIKPAVGLNFTNFSKDPVSGKQKAQVGYQVGGSVAFGKKWYIEPGIFWVKKSTEYVEEGQENIKPDYNISGIRVPVNIGVNLLGNSGSPIGVRAFGGASAFILTGTDGFDKDDLNSAAFGLHAGVGVDITIVFVEASYEWSLTNVQKNVRDIEVGNSRSLFLQAGVRLPLP